MLVERVADAEHLRDHWRSRPDWPDGTRHLHWYLTFEEASSLHHLAATAQHALSPFPELHPVSGPWLHLTLVDLGDASELADDCVRQVINAVHLAVDDHEPWTLDVSRTVVLAESVVLVPQASAELSSLRDAVVRASQEVLPRLQPPPEPFTPHIAVAYTSAPAVGDEVVAALAAADLPEVRGIRPTLSLAAVSQVGRQYTWRLVSAYPL